jgi:indole-3-glycerol phosphate synthase
VTIDIASIVPSVRDFLQAIATQRKRLALVPLVERADEARALGEAGVTAFAMLTPSDSMRAVSAAVGSAPLLVLSPIATDKEALAARAAGADAVVIPTGTDARSWDATAKQVRTTRMAALAGVTDWPSAELCAKTTAKGVCLQVSGIAEVSSVMPMLGSMRVLARLPSVDETALRALRGVVDAVIVDSDLYLSTSFESLREELDP